ncbi:SKI family transcriptional corepressor 2 [Lampetra planeri]
MDIPAPPKPGAQSSPGPAPSAPPPHGATPDNVGGGGGGSSVGVVEAVSPTPKPGHVGEVLLYGAPIVSLVIDGQERLCLAQISNTLLKSYSYNEIHNRRVALGITCVQCTPVQLELLRRAGAMPVSSRRCGMITRREAERLCKSFLGDHEPPRLPENFAFDVTHECAWGCRGSFVPARYNSSRAKCIKCSLCGLFFSPNKFIFHSHRAPDAKYVQPDAANFNSWRRHLRLTDKDPSEDMVCAWEDVKAMFNGGSRKRGLPPMQGNVKSQLDASHQPDGSALLQQQQIRSIASTFKRARFSDGDALPFPREHPAEYVAASTAASFGKARGQLQLPSASLPGFPNFHHSVSPPRLLAAKKDDGLAPYGVNPSKLGCSLWPAPKEAVYSPFYMLWHLQSAHGGVTLPKFPSPQPQPQLRKFAAHWIRGTTATPGPAPEAVTLCHDSDHETPPTPGSSVGSERCSSAHSRKEEDDEMRPPGTVSGGGNNPQQHHHHRHHQEGAAFRGCRPPPYISAFRPVVAADASEMSIAKLHGAGLQSAADAPRGRPCASPPCSPLGEGARRLRAERAARDAERKLCVDGAGGSSEGRFTSLMEEQQPRWASKEDKGAAAAAGTANLNERSERSRNGHLLLSDEDAIGQMKDCQERSAANSSFETETPNPNYCNFIVTGRGADNELALEGLGSPRDLKPLDAPLYFQNENLHTFLLHQMAMRRKLEHELVFVKDGFEEKRTTPYKEELADHEALQAVKDVPSSLHPYPYKMLFKHF